MKLKLLVRLKTAIAVAFWLSISTQVVFGQSLTQSVWFVPPERPTTLSLIGKIRPTSPRCPCSFIKNHPSLTALAFFQKLSPNHYVSNLDVWGYTIQDYPSFWFYIPGNTQSKYLVEFSLEDQDTRKIVYKTEIVTPNQSGIVEIALPETISPLEVSKPYRWVLSTTCEPGRSSDYRPTIQGVVIRIRLDQKLIEELSTATPLQQATLYATNGIWYDALTALAQLRQKFPQDNQIISNWRSLLQSVDLAEMVDQPFVKGAAVTTSALRNVPDSQNRCR